MLPIHIFPLLISPVIGLFLVFFITRNRLTADALALVALIIGASLWAFGYALEFISPVLETKLFWAKFQYFGIVTTPLAWFAFAMQFLGAPGLSARQGRVWAILGIIPAITVLLVWTNEFHGLVWNAVRLQTGGPVHILDLGHGPWFWVFLIFSYCLLLVGSVRLIGNLLGSVRFHSWQTTLMFFAVLIPWLSNFAYVTHLTPVKDVDWTPFSFIIAGLIFTISLYRFRLINILPIAQKTVWWT